MELFRSTATNIGIVSLLLWLLLAPIVYLKITRKLDRLFINFDVLVIFVPIVNQIARGFIYSFLIFTNNPKWVNSHIKSVISDFNFHRKCSQFDIILSMVNIVVGLILLLDFLTILIFVDFDNY